jgi:hypothetical protein
MDVEYDVCYYCIGNPTLIFPNVLSLYINIKIDICIIFIMDCKSSYIKTDNNTFINEQNIVWVKQMNDCLTVATMETDALFTPFLIQNAHFVGSYE